MKFKPKLHILCTLKKTQKIAHISIRDNRKSEFTGFSIFQYFYYKFSESALIFDLYIGDYIDIWYPSVQNGLTKPFLH